MDSNKQRVVFSLTNEFHNDITNIYESVMDEENSEAFEIIDELRSKLKGLKDNLIKNKEI
jgi:uncharacterized phage infection (PIP) family protein YhgE